MRRSTDRILTSQVGSLVRPPEIAALFAGRPVGKAFDNSEKTLIQASIGKVLVEQVAAGIDVPSDGEYSKSGFAGYISDRLSGFEEGTWESQAMARGRDRTRFADAYATIEGIPGPGQGQIPLVCAGPVQYVGQDLMQMDLDNLKAACRAAGVEEAFVPAMAPGTIAMQRPNQHYASDDEYLAAVADAMAVESG